MSLIIKYFCILSSDNPTWRYPVQENTYFPPKHAENYKVSEVSKIVILKCIL